jgi:hypothetical protein
VVLNNSIEGVALKSVCSLQHVNSYIWWYLLECVKSQSSNQLMFSGNLGWHGYLGNKVIDLLDHVLAGDCMNFMQRLLNL